jgi:hypothetical protein
VDLRRPRALLQRLADATKPGEPEGHEPVPAPAPAPLVRGGAGMVDWWAARNAGECKHPNPRTVQVGSTAVPYWCPDCKTELHLDVPHDEPKAAKAAPEPAEAGPDDQGQGHDEPEHIDGGEKKTAASRRWSMRGSGKKTYNRPVYGGGTSPQKSLMEAWSGLRPATRHGLYNGTALAIDWQLNVPQFVTDETAYLVHTYHSWTHPYVCIWYGVAAAICTLDHRTRNWLPPFALLARIPLISLVVGVLLYGNSL